MAHTSMPNEKNGIEAESGTIKGNYIGYNKQNGIVLQRGNVEENYIGGIIDFEPTYRFGNGKYGLSIENTHFATDVINNHFVDNSKGGIYTADPSYSPGYDDDEIRVTKNLFGGDQDRTIYGTRVNSPIIDTIHYDDDYYKAEYILIKGKVNFSTLPSGVTPDKEKVGIEIYLSLGVNSAYKYVGYTESDKDGNWVYKIPKNMVDPNRYFTATAVHYGLVPTAGNRQVSVNYTSALSAPKWFGYKPTALKYYVKENGKGDGSSWDKAMGPDEFATYLPIVPSGSVFYVAQGMYHPIYNSRGERNFSPFYKINNNVTIHGGFSKEAKSGAIADPSVYKTIFSGDIQENDKIIESVDEYGALIIERPDDFYKDNSLTLFEVYGEDCTVNIDGVCIEGSTNYGLLASREKIKLNVNLCEFTNNNEGILYYSNNKLSVLNSIFKYNTAYAIQSPKGDVDVKKCEFAKNYSTLLFAGGNGNVNIDSISVHDNTGHIMCVDSSKLRISNSEFYDNHSQLINAICDVTVISKTNFRNNNSTYCIIEHHGNKMILDSCLIDNNKASYCINGTNDFYIYNSSITNNESKSELLYNASGNEFVLKNSLVGNNVTDSYLIGNWGVPSSIINSTIVDNKCSSIVYATSNASYYNNTIVANECSGPVLYDCSTTELIGNILTGNIHGSDALTFYGTDTSAYNIIYPVHKAGYGYDSIKGLDNYFIDDLDKEKSLLSYLFDVDGSDNLLIKDNGGFTPTVALKSDKLSDGKSIRFPRLDDVLTDQRGVSRRPETCMGAYELGCGSDTTFTTDTINVGDKILGQTFTKVGVHDSIFETLQTAMGCDSVVMHKVVVKPDPKTFNYYVKTKKAGKGDGSNWENAMDGDDFETYLPLAPDGATFYVAAGTYKPSSGTYNTSASDISIIGGFPADINIGADSKPDKYKTIFSADLKGNDKVSIIRTTDGIDSVTFANREDNASVILSMGNAKNTLSKSRLSGLVFEGATGIAVSLSGDYTVDHCEFKYNKDGLYLQTPLNIDLSKSYFHDNKIAYRKSRNEKTVTNETVDGCTFENNYCSILQSGIERLEVTNSTFYNNGFFEFYEGQNLLLKNNTIVGPYLFNATYTHTSPKTWNLLGNVTKVENYVRDNLFVCREEHPEIGDGSSTNPYKITSASELLWFSKLVSKGTDCQEANPSACAYLSTDIDLSTVCGKNIGNWTPITNFSGTFDGTGHTVSGLYYVSAEEGYVGLFGIIKEGAVVKNVTVSGYLRNGGTIGGVVGAASASTIENCKNLAFVQSTEKFAGGIAGYSNSSTIDRCCNFGTVIDTAGGYAKVGGICAGTSMATTITNCLNAGEITSIARGGGIIGSVDAENTKLSNSFNYGLVVSLGNTRNTDPICGYITQGSACSISNTYSLTQSKNVNVDVLTKEEFADGTLLANLSKNNAGVWTSGSEFPVLVTPMYSKYEGGSRVPEPEPISLLENNLWKYSISSKYNLFNLPSLGENWKYDETDLVYTTEDWSSFMEGSIDSKKFIPKLSYNGGFTPTVALKEDNLPNDTSIRFPLSETTVTEDQRGVSRLPETCMGAYEIGCGSDTTFSTDTINVGTKIYGQTFTKVGVHDSIFETLQTAMGCDSVVMHKVVVKPDPKTFNYYVKMKKEGDGDGRDWDNAMDSTDFATYLPLAPDGATFYVAAGTYKPVYDVNMNIPSDLSDLCYAINSSVTIRGGYPADAKGKDVPSEPKKYHTVFDGDIDGDDEISETKDDDYLSVSVTNRKDNSSYMFFSQSNKELHVGFDGISVKNSGGAVYILKPDKNVKISNSEFTYNDNAVYMPYEGENLEVYNSKFSKNFSNVIYMPTASNLTMDSILFENNQRNLVYIPGTSGVNPDHNVRLNRIYAYANGDSSAIVYSIGHDFVL
ncbi:MAG: right-handed parallel beta-helix repeat-containing protein, partial [Bacteroidales bacterium]|nr:right-handed parallel beta-helix repeat-containing protein [Bacteroidales bacterium]